MKNFSFCKRYFIVVVVTIFLFLLSGIVPQKVKACGEGGVCCGIPIGLRPIGWRQYDCRYTYECRPIGDCGRCVNYYNPYTGDPIPCCEYPTGGVCAGGGGGNRPPSCTIDLQSPITYDAMEYLYDSYNPIRGINAPPNPPPPDDWRRVVIPPTTVEGQISTSDPDGDRVRITRLTVSKPECLKVTRNGKTLYATPQGKITGQTPTLDGVSYCDVRIRVQVSDGRGGTNNCSKTIRVNYPKPRKWSIWLYDHNDASVERQPANPLRDIQFYYIGSSRFYEPFIPILPSCGTMVA